MKSQSPFDRAMPGKKRQSPRKAYPDECALSRSAGKLLTRELDIRRGIRDWQASEGQGQEYARREAQEKLLREGYLPKTVKYL